jgi:hypothetical protein
MGRFNASCIYRINRMIYMPAGRIVGESTKTGLFQNRGVFTRSTTTPSNELPISSHQGVRPDISATSHEVVCP